MASQSLFSEEKNPRGIPKAPFIVSAHAGLMDVIAHCLQENVESYLGGSDAEVEGPLKRFQDALAYAGVASAIRLIWLTLNESAESIDTWMVL